MKALVMQGPRKLSVSHVARPSPPEGWALVRSGAVGICGTDKAFYRGTYPLFKKPLIPGHEVSGVVVEGPENLVGARVVSEINFSCGRCDLCRGGLYTHCTRKLTLGIDFDGGMAEYFVAPAWALHTHNLPHEEAFAAEPLAAVINAFRLEPPRPGWRIAVLGTGFISHLAVQVLRHWSYRPVVVARDGSPKIEAFRRLGADVVTYSEIERDLKSNMWRGLDFDMVFEATGSNTGLPTAVALARPRGVIHVKSTPGGTASFSQTLAVVKEVRIVGSRCGSFYDFREALRLLREGAVKPHVNAVYSLEESQEAFEESLKPGIIKVLVKP